MFLRKKDYDTKIGRMVFEDVLSQNEATLDAIENDVLYGEIAPRISHRYDVTAIFKDLNIYDSTKAYAVADWVVYPDEDGTIYTIATATAAGETPVSDPAKFTEGDPRSQLIIRIATDMVIYQAFAQINPRQIQALRETRYQAALQLLLDIQSGEINPDSLTEIDAENSKGYSIRFWTSQTKNTIHW